jgi:hypothetical protein
VPVRQYPLEPLQGRMGRSEAEMGRYLTQHGFATAPPSRCRVVLRLAARHGFPAINKIAAGRGNVGRGGKMNDGFCAQFFLACSQRPSKDAPYSATDSLGLRPN